MMTIDAMLFSTYIVGCGRFLVQIASFFYAELSEQYKRKINYLKIFLAVFLQLFLIIPSFFKESPIFLTMLGIYSIFLIYGLISDGDLESVGHKDLKKFKQQMAGLNRLLGLSLLTTIVFNIAQVHFLMMIGSISAFLPIIIKEIIKLDLKNKIFSEKTRSRLLISLKYFEYFDIASLFFIVVAAFQIFTVILLCIDAQKYLIHSFI